MGYLEQNDPLRLELERLATEDGLSLYDVERLGDQGLRIVLAKPAVETTGGDVESVEDLSRMQSVTSGECSRFCKRLMVFFSVEGPRFRMNSEPQLEVSSPGVNRTLRVKEHFSGAVGERIRVTRVSEPQADAALVGVLERCADDQLLIRDEQSGAAIAVLIAEIKKARVDFRFEEQQKRRPDLK